MRRLERRIVTNHYVELTPKKAAFVHATGMLALAEKALRDAESDPLVPQWAVVDVRIQLATAREAWIMAYNDLDPADQAEMISAMQSSVHKRAHSISEVRQDDLPEADQFDLPVEPDQKDM